MAIEFKTIPVLHGEAAARFVEAADEALEKRAVQTDRGVQYKNLTPDMAPRAEFALCEGETVEAVYAYCNLHGLWEA